MLVLATLSFLVLQLLGALSPSHAAAVAPGYRSPTQSNSVSVPANWGVYGYLFNITVGNPPQNIPMLCDMTWKALFVRSSRCMDIFNPELCDSKGQTFFEQRNSRTFKNTSFAQVTLPVTPYAPNFTVDYGRDVMCIGGICNKNTLMQVSDFPYPGSMTPVVPFGGIYGLAPKAEVLADGGSDPATFQAWEDGKLAPLIGWHTCDVLGTKATCHGGDSKLVFGGTDETMYAESEMQSYSIQNPEWLSDAFFPVVPARSNYWATRLTGMWIKTKTLSKNYAVPFQAIRGERKTSPLAVVNEGSEGLGAPLSENGYKRLVEDIPSAKLASNATIEHIRSQGSTGYNTKQQDWYTVDCGGLEHYPDLVYQLDGGKKYTIPPQDYVTMLANMPGSVCYLNINTWKFGRMENGDAKVILLGKAFLKRHYLVLNFEERSFSLAPLREN
ncbi:fusarin C cluster-peptidase [Fusarium circinatum]|uniref:Fusarin C cluster-peptidase n=1 Tax=Fusarium circinatum TaxID=48490 RepID=A0A8H5UA77_FUSCI|nr:fusarin C cluster-peptidase [Fusarium circinatum]